MNTFFILVVVILSNGVDSRLSFQEFSSIETCKKAEQIVRSVHMKIHTACVPK